MSRFTPAWIFIIICAVCGGIVYLLDTAFPVDHPLRWVAVVALAVMSFGPLLVAGVIEWWKS